MYTQQVGMEGRCTHNRLVRGEDVHTTDWYGGKMYTQQTGTEGTCTHNRLVRREDVHTTVWYGGEMYTQQFGTEDAEESVRWRHLLLVVSTHFGPF